ncbi:MAG: PrsW family glutamic-type intramembrane protease, partial [Planctomycetota bacterium]
GAMAKHRRYRPSDRSIDAEPHLTQRPTCARCGYDRVGIADDLPCPECGAASRFAPVSASQAEPAIEVPNNGDHRPDQSVWNNPELVADLAGPRPNDAADFAAWFQAGCAHVAGPWPRIVLIVAAVLTAGPFAVVGTFLTSYTGFGGQTGIFAFAAVAVVGPLIEEVMKVILLLFILELRPYWLGGVRTIMAGAIAGGLGFAVIENVLYLRVYIPDPEPSLVVWRWTVCVGLHVGCSVIAGLGVLRGFAIAQRDLRPPDMHVVGAPIVAAAAVHGVYNASVVILSMTGAF